MTSILVGTRLFDSLTEFLTYFLYCVDAYHTEIFCKGKLVKRKDEDRLDEVGYDNVSDVRKQMAQIC